VDIQLEPLKGEQARILRFTDPRRFGCLLWQSPGTVHELLAELGPEPLTDAFDGDLLFQRSRGRKAAVKLFLMDNAIVVGVGNIYASEALFAAGIDPRRSAGSVSRPRYQRLAGEVKRILAWAIERGGTTLRDFLNPDGAPGYFFRELFVYGREGEPCKVCGTAIRQAVIGQRSTFWCPRCQK
jgi:formamidopyrimidine-DNA glycosylase